MDVEGVSVDFTGFAGLHSTCLFELKSQNAYMETYRGYNFVRNISLKLDGVELTD